MKEDGRLSIMLGYSSFDGDDFSRELLKLSYIGFVYNASTYEDQWEDSANFKRFNFGIGRMNMYDSVCNMDEIPSLSETQIKQIEAFEPMIMKLAQRKTHFPIIDYEREKIQYLNSLRFWSYVFDTYCFDLVIFDNVPHFQYNYIIYVLALIRKIPIITFGICYFRRMLVGSTIESLGDNIQEFYNRIIESDDNFIVLEKEINDFYRSNISGHIEKTTREIKKRNKKSRLYINNAFFSEYLGIKSLFLKERSLLKVKIARLSKHYTNDWYNKKEKYFNEKFSYNSDIKYFLSHRAFFISEYDKIAKLPDYNTKYIYYSLQLTPEETTMPRAGVFADQYLAIYILARAAKKYKMKVYVKEHYVQEFRTKEFVEAISAISNVILIKTYVDSYDLIKNAIAVASQTGTCILESGFHNKVTLVFGPGCQWKGLPNAYRVSSEKDVSEIIEKIMAGKMKIDSKRMMKKYLYAVQENSFNLYYPKDQADKCIEYWDSIQKKVNIINERIKEIM